MFEISDTLDKRFMAMEFVDYLQEMHDRIERISHRPKSNSAYNECNALTRHIKQRVVTELNLTWEEFDMKIGRNLRLSEKILDSYNHVQSDKRKSELIKEFVDNYAYDLASFTRTAQRKKNENPNTSFDADEI